MSISWNYCATRYQRLQPGAEISHGWSESHLGGWLNTTVTLMLTSPLSFCTRATCRIVRLPVWQYNSCYSFVDMLQKLER
jgi:hypothetical protein